MAAGGAAQCVAAVGGGSDLGGACPAAPSSWLGALTSAAAIELGSGAQAFFASTPLLCAVLSSPHVLYALVWLWPHVWRSIFKQRSVEVFAACGGAGKVLQLSWCFLWTAANLQPSAPLVRQPFNAVQLLVGAALLAYGQALNMATYRALGVAGVYYGCRLGKRVAWVSGWPFSHVRHPQYVGSVLTVWGVEVLGWHVLPQPAGAYVTAFWTGLYVASAVVEDWFGSHESEA